VSSVINTERMEQAVLYLCSTDEQLARCRARFNGLKEQIKVVKSMAYQRSISTVAATKEQDAYSSSQYREHLQKMHDAEYDFMLIATKRETELTIIDCWRSLNAAKNKGVL
jgi:hypothetical protein